MKCLLTFFLFLNLILLTYVDCKISDKRLCVDEECSVPISNAKTILKYNSDDSRILSFYPKEDVTIYSKSAGDRKDLWGAEIKGKRGYVPKNLVRETKVYNKPMLTVPTESAKETNIVNETLPIIANSQNEMKLVLKGSFGLSGVSADTVPPDIKPQQANTYEIIDGTTLYEEVKDPPQPESEEISNTSKETPPLSVNTENLTIIEDSLTKVEGKPGDEDKYTDKAVSNQDSQRIEVTPNKEKDTTSKENIPNEGKTQETPSEKIKNLDVKTKEEKMAELLKKPVEQAFFGLFGESESSEEDEDEDYNETDLTSSEENTVTDKEEDNTPILQISPTGPKNNDFKTHIKDEDVKNTENTMEKKDLPISETVNPTMKYGLNDTDLKDKDNVKEKDDIPNSETVNPTMKYGLNDTDFKDKDNVKKKDDLPNSETVNPTMKYGLNDTDLKDKDNVKEKDDLPNSETVNPTMKYGLNDTDLKDKVNVLEKDDLPNSETVNPTMKYGLNDTDLKDKDNVTEENNLPNFKTPHSPGPVDLKMETPNVPKTEELDKSNNQKGEVMKEETNLVFSEIINVAESVETSTETPTVITKDEMETSKIVENKFKGIPDSVEDVGQPSMTDDKKAEDETKILETGGLPDELSNNTKDASNFISSTDSSIVENSDSITASIDIQKTVSSADNPKMTEDSSVSGIESPSISSEFKSGKANITDTTQDSNIDSNTLVEETTTPQIETNVDVPSTPLDVDTSIHKTEMTESSITGDQSDIKIQGLNSFDSGISPMQKPEIKNEIDENNNVEENVDMNSTESYDSTESVEQTEIPSKIETEDGFAAVVEEVTEDTVKITTEDTVVEEGSSGGIFSWFTSLFYGSDIPTNQIEEVSNVVTSHPEEQTENLWKHPSHIEDPQEESCTVTGLGEDTCPKLHQVSKPEVWASSKSSNADFVMMSAVALMDKIPLEMTLLLVVTSIVVLIFTLGHYYIEAHRRDGSLVARINQLERDLLVKKKENSILEDAWSTAQFEVKGRDCEVSEIKETNEELLLELEELKALRSDLEEQITSLEKELETATESGLEMHRLFSESLSTQDGSQVLLHTVESLREKLDKQDTQIALLNRSLGEKNEEIEMLQDQMSTAEEESKTLNEKLNRLKREKEEEELEIKEKHRALIVQLEEVVETKALEESRMSMEMSKLRISLEEMQRKLIEREAEVDAMKDSVRQLRATDQEESLQELYDVAAVSAKLTTAIGERDEFREKFIEEEGARKLLEDHVRVISREVAELKENFEAAEKEKIEALTKLKVLSNYFKEKETELQKELGSQESMWLQKQGDDHTIYEQMRSLREENDKFNGDSIITLREVETKCKKMINGKITPKLRPKGLQNESLKKEICEQESSFKIQLANVEQRAHENWVASRQAERRLKEIQQEATQLRNRLTLSEKNAANHEDPKQKINETNGELSSPPPSLMFSPTTSPPFMMYHGMGHIPPSDFIPPPPLVSPFSPDSRPPPLGRISSPPLDPRFSPPPPMPFSHPYDYSYGHHSPSPPLPLPHRTVHKPQPREAGRVPKDIQLPPPALGLIFEPPPPYLCSPSPPHRSNNTFANTVTSNYSVDSTDKPIRRGKRSIIGKTTAILCLAPSLLGPAMKQAVLELNAFSDRGIDIVLNKIKMFALQKIMLLPYRHKIVILDEADRKELQHHSQEKPTSIITYHLAIQPITPPPPSVSVFAI